MLLLAMHLCGLHASIVPTLSGCIRWVKRKVFTFWVIVVVNLKRGYIFLGGCQVKQLYMTSAKGVSFFKIILLLPTKSLILSGFACNPNG